MTFENDYDGIVDAAADGYVGLQSGGFEIRNGGSPLGMELVFHMASRHIERLADDCGGIDDRRESVLAVDVA